MLSISDLRKKYLGAPQATDEELNIVRTVREYVDAEIMPRRKDLEGGWYRNENLARKTFDEVYQGLVDIDVQRAMWPEELGGLGVSDVLSDMINEEIARGDVGVAIHKGIIAWVMSPALVAGRMDLLQQFVPIICNDKIHGACMAITEPSGGTNVEDPTQHGRPIETIAKLDGNEWVINGHKIWPSGAGASDITYCTICTTDPNEGDAGIAIIYVPPDAKGLSFSQPYEKMGMCWTDINAEIYYDNVRVPKENRVAGPGEDAKILHDIVAIGRLGTCYFSLGPAQACFEIALEWTKNRVIAGKSVRSRSLHASIIGEMALRIESARSYAMQVTYMTMNPEIYGRFGEPFLLSKCSAAKEYACDVSIWVANKTMELMGAYGYCFDYHVEKYLRDVKIAQLWLGGPQRALLDTALGYYNFEW